MRLASAIGLAVVASAATAWFAWPTSPASSVAATGSVAPATPNAPAVANPLPAAIAAQRPSAPPVALASIDEMLRAPPSPDWQWWRYKANPAVLVIEFPSLQDQGMAMNRLAAMFEKRGGRRDRPLNDAELAQLLQRSGDSVASFYQGHDYPGYEPARFFSIAALQRTRLNRHEERLRELLIDTGVMQPAAGGGYIASGPQAVISFTAVQADDPSTPQNEQVDPLRREAVLRHELSHGEFFTNSTYRDSCLRFWRSVLSEAERQTFRRYLKSLDYDSSDEELMANETQALLMHTPDARAFSAAALGVSQKALDALRQRFSANEAASALAAGAVPKARP